MRVKNIRCGVRKLCRRAAAQLDLFQQQMRLLGRKPAAEPGNGVCSGAGRSASSSSSAQASSPVSHS